MAEPKGGPVKPPTLDLKPKHSRPSATKQKTASSDQARSSAQYQAGTQPKSAQSKSAQSTSNKPKFSSTVAAIIGVVGGALLALLLLIPMLMSGVFQPSGQYEKNTEIDTRLNTIVDLISTNQQRSGQELVDYLDAMDQQVNTLRQDINQDLGLIQTQIDQISSTQQNLLAQSENLNEQNTSLLAQFEIAQANTPPITPPFDATTLEESILALSARLDAIAAGASNEDAEKLLTDLSQMQTEVQTLSIGLRTDAQQIETIQKQISEQFLAYEQRMDRLAQLGEEQLELINQQSQSIEELAGSNQTTSNQVTSSQTTSGQTSQGSTQNDTLQPISLQSSQAYKIQSDLNSAELALANGQPFLLELQSLKTQLPNLQIPDQIQQAAAIGLPTPSEIISQFNLAIPDMLAVRPAEPRAGWISQIGNSVKSALAIRPTGLTNGDPIENMLNQTLAAVDRADFHTAYSLLEQLPAPMFEVTGDLADQIGQFGNSQNFIDEIKQSLAETSISIQDVTNITNSSEVSP